MAKHEQGKEGKDSRDLGGREVSLLNTASDPTEDKAVGGSDPRAVEDRLSALEGAVQNIHGKIEDLQGDRQAFRAEPNDLEMLDYLLRGLEIRVAALEASNTEEFKQLTVTEIAMPPLPPRQEGSRAFREQRGRISATCDSALEQMFHEFREARSLNASRALDTILFNFFWGYTGTRPALSFESASHGTAEDGDKVVEEG